MCAPPFTQMPLVSIICPHCEKSAQVQVTEVARSRACPCCGAALMLQVAERSSGIKRKALLVSETQPTDESGADAFRQRQFVGAPFDRMRADPELAKASRRLSYGVAAVMSLIAGVTILSVVTNWGGESPSSDVEQAVREPQAAELTPAPQRSQHLPPLLSRPLDFEQIVQRKKSELAKRSGSE